MMRNLNTPNFNLGNRRMDLALKNALIELGQSYKSVATNHGHIKQFTSYLFKEHGIRQLAKIEHGHVAAYANVLVERYDQGEISASTAQNALSAINSAMSQARQDEVCRVTGKEAGLPGRTFVATKDKSVDDDKHMAIKAKVSERLASQLDLQRTLGLRFKESCLINANNILKQAKSHGTVRIIDGTKGGRPREVPITSPNQMEALKVAAQIQGEDKSMIPPSMTFKDYREAANNEIRGKMAGFHGERHTYANDRYEKLSGLPSPVRAGIEHGKAHHQYISQQLSISISEAKALDHAVRLQISNELGHGRIDVTNSYLG
ncbi:integrase domain-containing protein [Photobacterium sp. BZF1]|uniref:integrase domain-containing protein n=1 Tax=Photobacterium sp. BZF1 TaxID=1904457 RepID=UPI0016535EA8|nr:integrase domain-containing protein [Photobacterium sp. BZF1]MBC7002732.1 integrase domain-containing protein [Photobacterium sp. BZF1]